MPKTPSSRQRGRRNRTRVTTEPTLILNEAWTEGTLYLPEGHLWYSLVSVDEDQPEPLRVLKTTHLFLSADDESGEHISVVGPTPWEPLNDSFSFGNNLTVQLCHPSGQIATRSDFDDCDNGLLEMGESIETRKAYLGSAATLSATDIHVKDELFTIARSLQELGSGVPVKWWPLDKDSPTDPEEIMRASEGIDMLLNGTIVIEIQWFSDNSAMNDLLADVHVEGANV